MWKSIEYNENMLDEMIDMAAENYGNDNDISKKVFISHEYFHNPMGNACIKLAYDMENKILAGQYIVIPMKIRIDKQEYHVILSLNTLTRERYRGQKIFVTLAEEVYRECGYNGYKFCYGAPNPNSHATFVKRLEFKEMGIIPLYLKIIHPSLLVKQKFNNPILTALSKPLNVISRKLMKLHDTVEIILIDEDNAELLDDFWYRIKDKYPIMGVRTSDFIKWRYINMPERDYFIWAALKNGTIEGYIIGRIMEVSGMKCGMVVDFLATAKMADIAEALLEKVQEEFYRQDVGLMGCLMQNHFEETKWLIKNGFFKCPRFMEPQPFPIIFRNLGTSNSLEKSVCFENWFFTMGDYDVI